MDEQPPRMTGEGRQAPSIDPNTPARPTPQRRQGGPPRRPLAPSPQPNPFLVGMAIATVLAAISVIAFGLFSSTTDSTASDATTATTAPGDTTPGDTTAGDTTPGDSTPGDTTPSSSSTTPSGTTAPVIGAVGDAISLGDLTMSSDDIGPLDFGDAGNDVLGRLVSTFGEPTDDTGFTVGDGGWGECPGDSIRVVRWGPLNIVTRGDASNHVFVSYRMDLKYGGVSSSTTDMQTVSGLRVSQTVGELEDIYQEFAIEYLVHDVGLTFELRAAPGDSLLLWGPVESNAPGSLVTGIYSPDSCDPDAGA